MEIPYNVTPRKDTGLYNAKVGIWLFLASEVMLFGGLFSGYVFLRVYADFPWPERTLPIVPGLINTFILIASSVTVVFAWASLKMRKWRQFQVYMVITLLCAAIFMVLKAFEYDAKWNHQAVRMKDFVVVEGHTHKFTIDGEGHLHHYHPEDGKSQDSHDEGQAVNEFAEKGFYLTAASGEAEAHGSENKKGGKVSDPFETNKIVFKGSRLTVDLENFYDPFIRDIMTQAQNQGSQFTLSADFVGRKSHEESEEILAKKGELLSLTLLDKLSETHLAAKAHNAKIKTAQNRDAWAKLRKNLPAEERNNPTYLLRDQLAPDEEFDKFIVESSSSVSFELEPAKTFYFPPRRVRESADALSFNDGTLMQGELDSKHSAIEMAADAIDFRFVAQRAEEKGIDPAEAIEKTWLMQNNPEVKALWEQHSAKIAKLEEELLKEHGTDKNGQPKQFPTDTERYRITWQELVNMGEGKEVMGAFSGFTGPSHTADYSKHFPELVIPREEVNLESKFTPRWNNYYAIYFLITALHGLHVIGGIIVLGHFLFFGKKIYLNNPEHLANRVEVGGLFWHFVDLVWIFLFPILYLM
ncbi:cytochrome c oxidase subunit 3 [Roseibacillus ishigakijimensis]|uniref:Heme-copper oxidase subunit III n=1 Tax=Roseibacillus ishigakijimensis TaxID=454146 RepID=A0A934VIB5_9BACT|nr:cytochrome c oxidase subunit 3 [Roseibacillus ishigakijimensis]MBK1834903.1 heme-copper oxidase subunit III [Roseibacillus ishigakijimensis]